MSVPSTTVRAARNRNRQNGTRIGKRSANRANLIPPLNTISRVWDIRRESRLCTRPAQPTEGLSANGWTSHDLTSPKLMLERASERRAQSGNLRIEGQSQG